MLGFCLAIDIYTHIYIYIFVYISYSPPYKIPYLISPISRIFPAPPVEVDPRDKASTKAWIAQLTSVKYALLN
jgi:hypothetical protein